MEERQPKDPACCYEMGVSNWGAVGSVVHLAPDHWCHLHLGFGVSRCLALYVSGGCHECPSGVVQKLDLLQELGNTRSPACSRAGQMC